MVELRKLAPLSRANLKAVDWDWLFSEGNPNYLTDEVVVVRESEVEDLFLAGSSLFTQMIEAAERVISEGRLSEMGIPERMHRLIRETWDDDRQWLVFGRFDLAGGIDGRPPQLIEFNADTPTCVPETAILQWAHLVANGLDEAAQFNRLYEALVEQYERLASKNTDLARTIVMTGIAGSAEDDANLYVHQAAAAEAGFTSYFKHIDDVTFDPEGGIFVRDEEKSEWVRCDFMMKLVPWEYILQEGDLFDILEQIITKRLAVVVNPPYALLLQSKRLMKVAWDLNPRDPYLLETSYTPLNGRRCVEKPAFGREGDNVTVYHADSMVIAQNPGEYDVYPSVFQEFVDLPHDALVRLYQAGLFWAYEPCGLIFRRGGMIINDQSQFVGHLVEE